ncbi:accessory Sec system S-layer assembly protein [Pallidibacillus thermolactis]|uniref:accessory Sec system S-layer assembly protein n=1 Tax=Pallidibacillus thermolactis TaxID=251051 RepID=UPI002E1FB22A|nr:accessory Sec system S-layer assembly protein [Pallidibacillus thermolactis]MED1672551.1 accessory Sec system S-layer assembly protein [Pallidibacillus thermolactis subsp. kokeshiiformis]
MFKFFTNKTKQNLKKDGLDNTVDSIDILSNRPDTPQQGSNKEVYTKIYYHPSWNIDQEQRYVLNFLNNDLAPLKPNQLSLSGIKLLQTPKGLVVTAFVRSSLQKAVTFRELPLILLDDKKETIAKHVFDGNELGKIPAESSMPWQFNFPKESLKKQNFSLENWTLAFNLSYTKHRLDLEETWEKRLTKEEKEKLHQIVEQLPKLKKNELNFTGLQAKLAENGDFHVTVFLRNGSEKDIKLEKIPLQVTDATGDVVAEGGFSMGNFMIKANTTKPWTFIFPASLIKKDNIDLSSWTVSVIQ